MKHTWPLLGLACASLICFAVLAGSSQLAYASSNASASRWIHNGDSQKRTATDLHFVIRLAGGEGQNSGDKYWIESATITTHPPLGGSMTQSQRKNPDGNTYAIDVDYTGINVPYCSEVVIYVKLALSDNNCALIDSVRFTYPTGNPDKVRPGTGFVFLPQYPILVATGQPHTTTYSFRNEDDSLSVVVSNLDFYWADVWYPPETWTGSVGTLIYQVPGPITVPPGTYYDVQLTVPWTPPGPRPDPSYIYVYGEEEYQPTGFDAVEHHPFQDGHQETLVYGTPAIGTWGVLVLVVLLATAAVWFMRRRRVLGRM
jgi:hypothetical protein